MEKGDAESGLRSLSQAKDLQVRLLSAAHGAAAASLPDLPAQQAKAARSGFPHPYTY